MIGRETSTGDPIMLDLDAGQVLTAMHGQGEWDPDPIADSVDGLFAILNAFAAVARGREDPVRLEKNPVGADEREDFLSAVRGANPDLDPWWWISHLYQGEEPPP